MRRVSSIAGAQAPEGLGTISISEGRREPSLRDGTGRFLIASKSPCRHGPRRYRPPVPSSASGQQRLRQAKARPETSLQDSVLCRDRGVLRVRLESGDDEVKRPASARRTSSIRRGRSRMITASSLLPEQIEKHQDRIFFPVEMMDHLLAGGSDAAPSPPQAGIAEQGRFNRHGVITGHVSRDVRPFDVELIGLRDHADRVGDFGISVQRHL